MKDKELRELVASLAVQSQKTDAQLAKTDAQLAKTDAQLAKTDAQLAKTDAKLNRIADMVGGISNNQGDVAEEFFYNALDTKLELAGIQYDYSERNRRRRSRGIQDEFDIILINGDHIAVVETKYKAHENDLETFLTKKKASFEYLYPEYREYQHHYAYASFFFPENFKERALNAGVIILERKGDLVETSLPSTELR